MTTATTTSAATRDELAAEIISAHGFLFQPGDLVEIRVLNTKQGTLSGYSDDPQALARLALSADKKGPGIYWTINKIDPVLKARAADRLEPYAKHRTTDNNVLLRRNLLLDIDAVRLAGISSADSEHQAALDLASQIRRELMAENWPEPLVMDSGNGAYLIFRLQDLPNDDDSLQLAKDVLAALAKRFDTTAAKIDPATCNASRIAKVPGTTACKGDSTPDRPHRLSRLLDVPERAEPVPIEMLQQMAATVIGPKPEPRAKAKSSGIIAKEAPAVDIDQWIDEWLERVGTEIVKGPFAKEGGRKWDVRCPWDPEHGDRDETSVFQAADGTLGFHCLHESCSGYGWKDYRGKLEPGYAGKDRSDATTNNNVPPETAAALPKVKCSGRQLPAVSGEALAILQNVNRRREELFARAGEMVSIVHNEEHRQIIASVNREALCGRLARVAHYYRLKKNPDGTVYEVDSDPPPNVVKDIASLAPEKWGFRPLAAITEIPILRPDGTILETAGYDPVTRLYYSPDPEMRMPPIPSAPTADDIAAALEQIDEAISEFPFVDPSSKANMIAALLTPIIKPAIDDCTPMALLDAPQAGTGKSLLAEVVAIVGTGRNAQMISAPKRDEDEWRKKITMALRSGISVIIFDNITDPLENDALSMVLTAKTWGDRKMATFDDLSLPVKATLMATGNNIRIGGDMPRRCFRIRLDAQCSQPFLRSGFKIEHLKSWTKLHRGALLAALLTLARAWYVAGKPKPKVKELGSFEEWTKTVGGILEHAGVTGFLENLQTMYAETDDESFEWEGFLQALKVAMYDQPFTVADLDEALNGKTQGADGKTEPTTKAKALKAALPAKLADAFARPGSFQIRLGIAFRAKRERRFGKSAIRLERDGEDRTQVAIWKVVVDQKS